MPVHSKPYNVATCEEHRVFDASSQKAPNCFDQSDVPVGSRQSTHGTGAFALADRKRGAYLGTYPGPLRPRDRATSRYAFGVVDGDGDDDVIEPYNEDGGPNLDKQDDANAFDSAEDETADTLLHMRKFGCLPSAFSLTHINEGSQSPNTVFVDVYNEKGVSTGVAAYLCKDVKKDEELFAYYGKGYDRDYADFWEPPEEALGVYTNYTSCGYLVMISGGTLEYMRVEKSHWRLTFFFDEKDGQWVQDEEYTPEIITKNVVEEATVVTRGNDATKKPGTKRGTVTHTQESGKRRKTR